MRRGEMAIEKVFALLLFALLVILGIGILIAEKDSFKSERDTLPSDFSDQYAQTALVTLLRTSITTQLDGVTAPTIADLIIVNDGTKDNDLLKAVDTVMPKSIFYELTITYAGRKIVVANAEGLSAVQRGYQGTISSIMGESQTTLPRNDGDVTVKLIVAEQSVTGLVGNVRKATPAVKVIT